MFFNVFFHKDVANRIYVIIIPTRHHYAYFALFDWPEKKFYTSINSMSTNLRTNFLPPAPKMNSNLDKNVILICRSLHIDKIHKNKIRSYIDITKIKMGCDWCQLPIYDVVHIKLVICCRMKHCCFPLEI